MPTYVFRCSSCGDFEVFRTMATVGSGAPCPQCDREAPRRMTAPGLKTGGPAHSALAAHERSAHAPGVVGAPPSSSPSHPGDPRHARLPRP